jgi:hypothetical protein
MSKTVALGGMTGTDIVPFPHPRVLPVCNRAMTSMQRQRISGAIVFGWSVANPDDSVNIAIIALIGGKGKP